MHDDYFPSTQRTLMSVMLKGEDDKRLVALGCFYERYRRGLARVLEGKLRIQPVDADEVLNDFMLQKLLQGAFIEKYMAWREDPKNSQRKFRQYLSRSIQYFAIDWMRRQHATADLEHVAPPEDVGADLESACEVEWLQELLTAALRRTRDHYLETGAPQHWEVFLELWLQPDFLGKAPPSHDEIAKKYALSQKVSTVLTNALRMFTKNWKEVLAEELGTSNGQEIEDVLRDVESSVRMAKYIDARRLLLQVVRGDDIGSDSVGAEQLSRLFVLASNHFSELLPSEQEMLFQCYVGMPLCDYLSSDVVDGLSTSLSEATLETIVVDRDVDVDALRMISRALGNMIQKRTGDIPRPVAGVMRYMMIALADQRYGASISSVPRARLVEGIESALRHDWIDAPTRELFAAYVTRLDDSSLGK